MSTPLSALQKPFDFFTDIMKHCLLGHPWSVTMVISPLLRAVQWIYTGLYACDINKYSLLERLSGFTFTALKYRPKDYLGINHATMIISLIVLQQTNGAVKSSPETLCSCRDVQYIKIGNHWWHLALKHFTFLAVCRIFIFHGNLMVLLLSLTKNLQRDSSIFFENLPNLP